MIVQIAKIYFLAYSLAEPVIIKIGLQVIERPKKLTPKSNQNTKIKETVKQNVYPSKHN